jgi:hypothetical protein
VPTLLATIPQVRGGSDRQLNVIQFARQDADAGNNPEHHVKVMHKLTNVVRKVSFAWLSPDPAQTRLGVLDLVNVCGVHHCLAWCMRVR